MGIRRHSFGAPPKRRTVSGLQRKQVRVPAATQEPGDASPGQDPLAADWNRVLSHEIRQALHHIVLHVQVLGNTDRVSAARRRTSVELVLAEAQRISALLDDLTSRAARRRMTRRLTDVHSLIKRAIALRGPDSGRHRIHMRVVADPALPAIAVDANAMIQVLANLIDNAIAAMPQGGVLTLRAYQEADQIIVRVVDTGEGIAPGEDVYRPFVTTKQHGTGLGLAVARRVVELHGGSIWHEPTPGGGTTFVIELPAGEPG